MARECRFCGGDASEPDHRYFCDGQQGRVEADVVLPLPPYRFNGPVYEPEYDQARLTGQIARVWELMRDRRWRTLSEIEASTGDPPASISAQLRHLRKARFGSHTVEKRPRGDRAVGLWEYRLLPHLVLVRKAG